MSRVEFGIVRTNLDSTEKQIIKADSIDAAWKKLAASVSLEDADKIFIITVYE